MPASARRPNLSNPTLNYMETPMSKPTQPKANGAQTPKWMRHLLEMYESAQAHAFVLHFNTRDYAVGNTPLVEYLFKAFARRKVLVRYNLAEGIQFAMPTMRAEFDKYVGADSAPADAGANVLASLGMVNPVASTIGASNANQQPLPKTPDRALPLLETLLRKAVDVDPNTEAISGQACVVVEYAETVLPSAELSFMSPNDRTT